MAATRLSGRGRSERADAPRDVRRGRDHARQRGQPLGGSIPERAPSSRLSRLGVVTSDQTWLSAAGDLRGENALAFIPHPGATAAEVMLHAGSVTSVDAVTACAWRALIEYHARHRATRVVLTPPTDTRVSRLLVGLLGPELPKQFCFANDTEPPSGSRSRAVIMPATVIRSFDEADMIAGVLPQLGTAYARRPMRFLEGAYGELVDNAVEWAADSPIGAVVAAVHEREDHVLQLAVTDLGARIGRNPDAHLELERLVSESISDEGGLASLANQATRLDLEARIELAAGTGRLLWQDGGWEARQAQFVGGFTATVSVAL
jgi:hypothetical protein